MKQKSKKVATKKRKLKQGGSPKTKEAITNGGTPLPVIKKGGTPKTKEAYSNPRRVK